MKENMLSKLENTRLKEKLGMMTTQMEKIEKENRGEAMDEMAATQKSDIKKSGQAGKSIH
jgi:regulator of replication initiation timing